MNWSALLLCAALLAVSGCAETKPTCRPDYAAKAATVSGSETVVCRCGDCVPQRKNSN